MSFLIDPHVFSEEMEKHWVNNLGNVSSDELRHQWRFTGFNFEISIMDHGKGSIDHKWHVLSLPTGSGKTESAIKYCSMLADKPVEEHPGVLIVTRQIKDADLIAERINTFGSEPTAVAYHSDSKLNPAELYQHPTLVITHRAYELALDALHEDNQDETITNSFKTFHNRGFDERKLVIVDECLDIVEHCSTGLDGLRRTVGNIRQETRDKHQVEIEAIERVINVLEDLHNKKTANKEAIIPKSTFTDDEFPDLRELIAAVKAQPDADHLDTIQAANERKRDTRNLKNLHYIFKSWCYYSQVGKDHSMNTARLLVPESVKGCVVLDATASTNLVYELFDKADVKELHSKRPVRDYCNFTLHVSRGHRVGRHSMRDQAKDIVPNFLNELEAKLKDKDTLLICHKDVEPTVQKFRETLNLKTTHWGAVDGSNEWKDCDTVIVFGLPYLPDTWSPNVFMAMRGQQTTEWLNDPEQRGFNHHADIKKALSISKLSTDIIQGLNRIRIRKVVDSDGNCEPSEGYILLPEGDDAETILLDIRKAMPGIKIVDWDYRGQKRKTRRSDKDAALIKFFENMDEGETHSSTHVQRATNVSGPSMSRFIKKEEMLEKLEVLGVALEHHKVGKHRTLHFKKTETLAA